MKINFESEEQKQFYYQKYAVGVMRGRIIAEIVLGVLVMIIFPLLSYDRMGSDSIVIGVVVCVICVVSAFIYYLRLRKTYKKIAEEIEKDKEEIEKDEKE